MNQVDAETMRLFLTRSAITVGRSLMRIGVSGYIPDFVTKWYWRYMHFAMKSAHTRVFTSNGSKLICDPNDPVDMAMLFGSYERSTTQLLMRELQPGMVFFDVGAHIGYYTCLAARLVGSRGRVIAFEPHSRNVALLRNNVAVNGYDHVTVVNKAVSDRQERALLYEHEAWGSHSLYQFPSAFTGRTFDVETVSLDHFMASQQLNRVDMIKIDAEGAEVSVLNGMQNLLSKFPNVKIIIEFYPDAQAASDVLWDGFLDTLRSSGFSSIRLIDNDCRLQPVDESFEVAGLYANLFCAKE
jgi:FkbM family methyltransferase